MSLVKSTATIGGYTLVSRVLGFARDVTIAASLGAGIYSDAFFVAFRIPNYLRRLFAEGAFNSAFVPQFTGMLAAEGKDSAKQFASEAMSFLLLILLIVTGIFMIGMPYLMTVLAPGFSDNPVKFDATVMLTRITMPYIIFISLVSLLGGILNSGNKFAAVAATPIIMNLCLIIIPFFIKGFTPTYAHALAIAVMASGVAQWLWLVRFCKRQNMLPKLVRPRLTPEVKKLLVLIGPAALGAGVAQINLFIDTIIGTFFGGGVSYLYYADRISELPLAVIGIAVGTALLPLLSRHIREGKFDEANKSQNHAIELSLFFSLPAAIALLTIAEPIIMVMYQRGEFTALDTVSTFHTLMAFAVGLPAFVLVKILSPIFYAHQDTKTPFKIASLCIVVNLVFNLLLMSPLHQVGMALATSIASWVNISLLVRVLLKRKWLVVERELIIQTGKILASTVAMALALFNLQHFAAPFFEEHQWVRFAALITLSILGGGVYLAASLALDSMGIRGQLRRRFSKL